MKLCERGSRVRARAARIGAAAVALAGVCGVVIAGSCGSRTVDLAGGPDGAWVADASAADAGVLSDGGANRSPDASVVPAGCNPIAAEWDCLLPYPSDRFLADDPSLPSGRRVSLTSQAQIRDQDGHRIDCFSLHPADGWSVGTQILFLFPFAVDGSPLVSLTGDLERTLAADGPTVLVDAVTGTPVLHMAEFDPRAQDVKRHALVIRPLVRLDHQRRYVVGIRWLRKANGNAIDPPAGFKAIRDGTAGADPILGPLAARYDREVFPVLERAGFARADLIAAWDFTTKSEENATADMLAVRNDLAARLADAAPAVTVVGVQDEVDEHTFRIIEATMKVPLYVDSPDPGAMLNRGPGRRVVARGEADVPFTVLVPRSVAGRAQGSPPARLLQYGHGFFANRHEISGGFVGEFADRYGFVVVAADWWGMSDADRWIVMEDLTGDTARTLRFTDRVHQAMANFIALAAAATGPLADLPELQFGGARAYDPSAVYFYGISQGSILGGTYAALSPHVGRAVLGVGGADFSLIMFRARPFIPFLVLISSVFPDAVDQQKFAAEMQSSFDRIDPLTYAPHLALAPYPGGPAVRRNLLQIGIGDTQVPNVAAHLHARAVGAVSLMPAPRAIPAVAAEYGPLDGSAIAEFDFGIDPLPGLTATPPGEDNPVHEGVRRLNAGMDQIDAFLRPGGMIENRCDGVCDPE